MDAIVTTLCLMISIHQTVLEPTIQELGSKKFLEREEAQQRLDKKLMVPWEEFLVEHLRSYRNDPEISMRIRNLSFMRKWNNTMTEYGKYPWLDALPPDFPERRKILDEYLGKVGFSVYKEDYPNYRTATMLWLENLKQQGCRMPVLWTIQERMISNELFWMSNKRYPP